MVGSSIKSDKHFFLTSSSCKILMRFCFASIVYICCYPLLAPQKIKKRKKKKIEKENPKYKRIYIKKSYKIAQVGGQRPK